MSDPQWEAEARAMCSSHSEVASAHGEILHAVHDALKEIDDPTCLTAAILRGQLNRYGYPVPER